VLIRAFLALANWQSGSLRIQNVAG
jgi:hypothetical protein